MRRGLAPAALGFALLIVTLFADLLLTRRNFAGRDLLGYNLPIEKAVHDAYARGRLPVWVSEISGGRPLAANPNAGALYPGRLLLALFPFPVAMRLHPLLHWTVAGAGMIALLLSLEVSRAGAWVGAVTYVFSGIGMSEVFYTNHHPGVALLPWIVWAAARRGFRAGPGALPLAFLLGLDFLAGDVFTIGLALAAVVLWIAVETPRPERLARSLGLLFAGALAALLALPQIVAALLWAPHTHRGVTGLKLGESFDFSLSPWRLLELAIPFPFGPTWSLEPAAIWSRAVLSERSVGFFSTLYAGAFSLIALWTERRSRAAGARFARWFFAAALVLAVSPRFLPASWASLPSPLPLRYPEKFSVGAVFALGILAGLAFERLRGAGTWPRWTLAAGAALTIVAGLATALPGAAARLAVWITGADPKLAPVAVRELPPAIAWAGLLWIATVLALEALARPARARVAICLLLLTIIPVAANRRIAQSFRQEEVFSPTAFALRIARADPEGRYRTLALPSTLASVTGLPGWDLAGLDYWRRSWLYDTPQLWGRGIVFNQDADAGDLSRTNSLRRLATVAAGFRDSGPFFGALALRWEIHFRGEPSRAGYHRVGGDLLQDWDEHAGALPDIRWLERWQERPAPMAALAAVPGLAAGEVVLETGRHGSGEAAGGRVEVLERSPERLLLAIRSERPGWVFVLRGYWPYRRVKVDEKEAEVVAGQLAFSAVRVPAGEHRVQWQEELPGREVAQFGPVAFLVLALSGFLVRRGKKLA
jgi:hypothetical protein